MGGQVGGMEWGWGDAYGGISGRRNDVVVRIPFLISLDASCELTPGIRKTWRSRTRKGFEPYFMSVQQALEP